MRKVFYPFLISFLLFGFNAFAQQLPQFSHYAFNGMYLSPGYAGITGRTELTGIFRTQWTGYQASFDDGGAPKTALFSLSVPIYSVKGGMGMYVIQDQLGATKSTNATLSYSQHIKLGAGTLGIGVQGIMMRITKGRYRPNDPGDPSVPENSADQKFDLGTGVWYQSEKFYLGASVNNLLQAKYVFEDSARTRTPGVGSVTSRNHFFVVAGVNLNPSQGIVVTPTAIVKYDFNQLSLEAGGRVTYNEKFWFGAGYRLQEGITGMVGANLLKDNNLRVGFAYDLTRFGVEAKARSSQELMLSYVFPKPANLIKPPVRTPRYTF